MQQERLRGLLLDVDVKKADFYTTQLNLNESNNLLKDEMFIYDELNEDVVENICQQLTKILSRSYRKQSILCDQSSYGIEISFKAL